MISLGATTVNWALYHSSTADLAYHDIIHHKSTTKKSSFMFIWAENVPFGPYLHLVLKTSFKACSSQGEFKDIYYIVKTTIVRSS